MRISRDTRGEIGVFEDLQTLVVILVGIMVLLVSTMVNWSSFGEVEADQDLYDEAAHIIKQIEASDRMTAVNSFGSLYEEFALRQTDLEDLRNNPR
jgi:hypothetical protein